MKTWNANPAEVEKNWWIIDASGLRLGRLATQVANILRGKNKPIFTPNMDTGDFVIIINTDKIEVTGKKLEHKKYYRHSRFFGSLKEKTAAQAKEEDSTFLLHEAVRGMLPQNKLSERLIMKMKMYKDANHPHAVQKPQVYKIEQ